MSEFQIGDRVRVFATAVVERKSNRRLIKRNFLKPFEAVVTGETSRREGFTAYVGEDVPSFSTTASIPVVLVRTAKKRKEIDVFPADLELLVAVERTLWLNEEPKKAGNTTDE